MKDFERVFVARVVDGDTLVCVIPGIHQVFGYQIRVRLSGINCPELKRPDGQMNHDGMVAKQFTDRWVRSFGFVDLWDVKRDKYFRLNARVKVEDVCLNDLLIQRGLAVKV